MARKLDLAQLRKAKTNQFRPVNDGVGEEEKKEVPQKATITQRKKNPKLAPEKKRKVGRPIKDDQKPTRATSIRVHPDLVEVPKILAGITRKNVYSMYNEIILDALMKYKKKYPQILSDLKVPPKGEL